MKKFTIKLSQRLIQSESSYIPRLISIKSQNFSTTPASTQSADIKLEGKYKELIESLNKDHLKIAEEKEA
jgi:hypothetical protein